MMSQLLTPQFIAHYALRIMNKLFLTSITDCYHFIVDRHENDDVHVGDDDFKGAQKSYPGTP